MRLRRTGVGVLEREGQELLLDCLADEGLDFLRVEAALRLVDELAVAYHDHLRVVALDLHYVLEHFTHF